MWPKLTNRQRLSTCPTAARTLTRTLRRRRSAAAHSSSCGSMSACVKYMALSIFVLQNAGVILLMRYSKVHHGSDGIGYSSAVAVLMQECTKLPLCMILHGIEVGGPISLFNGLLADVRTNGREWLSLCVPALLYTIQNNALFLGLAHLEAAVAQVTYQGKIFTTALFSVCMLGRRLKCVQWVALVLLLLGIVCVQGLPERLAQAHGRSVIATSDGARGDTEHRQTPLTGAHSPWRWLQMWLSQRALLPALLPSSASGDSSTDGTEKGGAAAAWSTCVGVGAIVTACVCSSFAGVYFERVLKASCASLWLRNVQLGIFATAFAIGAVVMEDDPLAAVHGRLHGFGAVTWMVVGANAFGGLLVAITIKYADNILRGFAQAVALIVGAVGSNALFGFTFTRVGAPPAATPEPPAPLAQPTPPELLALPSSCDSLMHLPLSTSLTASPPQLPLGDPPPHIRSGLCARRGAGHRLHPTLRRHARAAGDACTPMLRAQGVAVARANRRVHSGTLKGCGGCREHTPYA